MKSIIVSLFFVVFALIPTQAYSYESNSFSIFHLFEVNINISPKSNSGSTQIDNSQGEHQENENNADYIFEYEDIHDIDIKDIKTVNDDMVIILDHDVKNFLTHYDLFINGFKIKKKLKSTRYFTDAVNQGYKIEKKYVQHALFDGDNSFYFKHKKNGLKTDKFVYFHGDLVTFDGYYQRIKCHGNFDRIVLKDSYGKIIHDKKNYSSSLYSIVSLNKNRTLDSGYYDVTAYCSNEDKSLYYVYHIGFRFEYYRSRALNVAYYGDYLSKTDYYRKKHQ